MSDATQDQPVMDGSTEATDREKLAGLIEQVDHDEDAQGAGAMADRLRDQVVQTEAVPEEPGDSVD